MSGDPDLRPSTAYFPHRGDVIDRRACPACAAPVEQIYRPGRARIYCTNACRQRAYRWRRANGIRMCTERTGPAERSHALWKNHALRDARDPASKLVDHRRRHLTVCGTFARPARFGRFTHNEFLPARPWSCAACTALIGAPDDPPLPEVVAHWLERPARMQGGSSA